MRTPLRLSYKYQYSRWIFLCSPICSCLRWLKGSSIFIAFCSRQMQTYRLDRLRWFQLLALSLHLRCLACTFASATPNSTFLSSMKVTSDVRGRCSFWASWTSYLPWPLLRQCVLTEHMVYLNFWVYPVPHKFIGKRLSSSYTRTCSGI